MTLDQNVTLKELLSNVELELKRLEEETRGLEQDCFEAIELGRATAELQKFDFLNQSLQALSSLVAAVAKDPSMLNAVDDREILKSVHLGDMIERLKAKNGLIYSKNKASSGNFELF